MLCWYLTRVRSRPADAEEDFRGRNLSRPIMAKTDDELFEWDMMMDSLGEGCVHEPGATPKRW